MKTLTKYENLTGKEVKIVDIPVLDEDGMKHDWLGVNLKDYTSLDLVPKEDKDILQIFADYLNQLKEIDNNQLDNLCQRFVDVYYKNFSKTDIEEEFSI